MASAAKRQATVAAVAQPPDASAARTWPIAVHLTPFAPGCERVGISDKRRWATFYGRTPAQVLRTTLTRCRLTPTAAAVALEPNGDVSLQAHVSPEIARLISSAPGTPVPFAIFWDGMTAERLTAELAALRAQGWVPPHPTETAD